MGYFDQPAVKMTVTPGQIKQKVKFVLHRQVHVHLSSNIAINPFSCLGQCILGGVNSHLYSVSDIHIFEIYPF